jgi:hypothetical protein
MKKKKKNKEKQNWTLAYTLVLQIMSYKLFFLVRTNWFSFQNDTCKLNHNLICFGLGLLFKSLETNLKLLTNRNAQFHWTLLLEPLFNVALKLIFDKYDNAT